MDKEAERQAWLDSLKPGDEIAYKGSGVYAGWSIRTVNKRTPAGWIVTDGYTFDKSGGCRGRDNYSPYRCEPVTESIRRMMQRGLIIDRLRHVAFERYSLESLETIYAEVVRNKLQS